MRNIIKTVLIMSALTNVIYSGIKYDDFFFEKTMRVDYYHTGDAAREIFSIDKIYKIHHYAGSKRNLIDDLNNGKYYYKIYAHNSGKLIFSKGFDSYFGEYKTSDEGINGVPRTYHETAMIPFPKDKIIFAIETREKNNELKEVYRTEIDPESIYIIDESFQDRAIKVIEVIRNGTPSVKVDLAIIGEGYAEHEIDKFEKDLQKAAGYLFSKEPFKSYKNSFNVYGVLKPSLESGADEPSHNSFKNTTLNCSFNSLGSERYLLTEDNKTLRDIVSSVPYDALAIMVNHSRYGGGGIYNFFCVFTSDNQWSKYLFIHEFGHSFAGLADEYYTSDVAYNEFYPRGIEPVEPNITALLDNKNLKWKSEVSENIEIPTPWEKEEFDAQDFERQRVRREMNKRIAELKRKNASIEEIQKAQDEYDEIDRLNAQRVDEYLRNSVYNGKVGAFEGAGYSSVGLYRPELDCIMFSKGDKPFCKVCEEAIIRVIKRYTE